MMKVLYIGNYKDGTGWANACLNNILALDSAGVSVVPRCITFNNKNLPLPQRVYELEQNDTNNADVCIQHTLPPYYSYNGNIKNIGFYVTETNTFRDTAWHKAINLMDEAWVPNKKIVGASRSSGVTIPIKIAPHSIDTSSFASCDDSAHVEELIHTFNFCFVGDFIHRKNIEDLLRAFHTEFHPSEPVNLFLKLSKHGYSSGECLNLFYKASKEITASLKIRDKYKKEIVITGFLERKHLNSVMNQCHCFVMPSYGEAWCIPALEAMALGMPVIYTSGTGMDDFCSGYAINAKDSPCYKGTESIPAMYTASSKWREIDVDHLSQLMRTAYETYSTDRDEFNILREASLAKAEEYDRKKVGKQLEELLNDS